MWLAVENLLRNQLERWALFLVALESSNILNLQVQRFLCESKPALKRRCMDVERTPKRRKDVEKTSNNIVLTSCAGWAISISQSSYFRQLFEFCRKKYCDWLILLRERILLILLQTLYKTKTITPMIMMAPRIHSKIIHQAMGLASFSNVR